jgi:hypothetical protein
LIGSGLIIFLFASGQLNFTDILSSYHNPSALIAGVLCCTIAFTMPIFDIETDTFPEFDYIVSTSAFNWPLTTQDNYSFTENILSICYNHSKKGVAIDFLTSYVDFKNPVLFHYSPERIFSIAKKITKRVCLRHDYPLFDFCIYLYPDFKGWRKE